MQASLCMALNVLFETIKENVSDHAIAIKNILTKKDPLQIWGSQCFFKAQIRLSQQKHSSSQSSHDEKDFSECIETEIFLVIYLHVVSVNSISLTSIHQYLLHAKYNYYLKTTRHTYISRRFLLRFNIFNI